MRTLIFAIGLLLLQSCSKAPKEIHVGFIAPLSERATDLGIAPSKAMELAVEEYNQNKPEQAPRIVLHLCDDQWSKENALPCYNQLKNDHNIQVVFIGNSDGTLAIQESIERDKVIAVNPINNDSLLSSLNANTFKIAKTTEEANSIIGIRIIELGLKNVLLMNYPNDFMRRATRSVTSLLQERNIPYRVIETPKGQMEFSNETQLAVQQGYDAVVFFGYKEFGFAMKEFREAGITARFFGSTVLLDPLYFTNSDGHIIGTECTFFTQQDGNYVLAENFLTNYHNKFKDRPVSVWPVLQSYDAMKIVLDQFKEYDEATAEHNFANWLRSRLLNVRRFRGVCGNISITHDGSSRGIYFSLYKYQAKGTLVKLNN